MNLFKYLRKNKEVIVKNDNGMDLFENEVIDAELDSIQPMPNLSDIL